MTRCPHQCIWYEWFPKWSFSGWSTLWIRSRRLLLREWMQQFWKRQYDICWTAELSSLDYKTLCLQTWVPRSIWHLRKWNWMPIVVSPALHYNSRRGLRSVWEGWKFLWNWSISRCLFMLGFTIIALMTLTEMYGLWYYVPPAGACWRDLQVRCFYHVFVAMGGIYAWRAVHSLVEIL